MSQAFDRLSPALQYQIVNALGFSSLRPVQEMTIGPIVAGKNLVVLAPTAGGKTEAAFFPLLSQMDMFDWRPVSVIYVAPIRALLNNQEERITRYAGLLGRRAFVWHGDVATSSKQAFCRDPADILMTTPESLEVMLMSRQVPAQRLFGRVRAVIIDEVHAFVGDDRGGHLSAVLERLARFSGQDIQRIGLSATVGNPETILAWAAGSSRRHGEVVRAPGDGAAPELGIDFVGSLENAARVVAALHRGRKRLVFVDSRRKVEAMGKHLCDLGVTTHVTHSSLSADERRLAERAFAEGHDCVIVATSALELGIDIGDLDHVLQIDAPTTVAAFLQRMGRTGRRPGTRPNCTFLACDDEALVRAAALVALHRAGYVEPVVWGRRAFHLLAHQIMALAIQEQGIAMADWWAWVAPATPFAGISAEERAELVEHMVREGILHRDAGRLGLGVRGERLYGFRHFAELYAVFSTPRTLTVLWGTQEIGSIDAAFVEQGDVASLSFTLGARAWQVRGVDWSRGVVQVRPAEHGGHARWQGRPVLLHEPLCRAIRGVVTGRDMDPAWSRRASARMAEVRKEHAEVPPEGLSLEREPSGALRLWTFAGGRANNLIARVLEGELGERVTAANMAIRIRDGAAQSEAAVRDILARLQAEGRPDRDDALRFAASCARGRLSKFEPCVPEHLMSEHWAAVLTDPDEARRCLAEAVPMLLGSNKP
jgi:ATP-dependent helicase Lhr and Lhr-like helicase